MSRMATSVRRTSMQLSSSLNAADFKEAKARLAGSMSRTDTLSLGKRWSNDSNSAEHPPLEASISSPIPSPPSPLASPLSRDAASLPATPMVETSPKNIDLGALKKGLTKAEVNDPKGSSKEEEVYQQGFDQGMRTQVSQELTDLREQQKVFCNNLDDLLNQAEKEEEEEELAQAQELERSREAGLGIFHRLKAFPSRCLRPGRIVRLLLALSVFLAALVCLISALLPLESSLAGRPLVYSPWRTLKELLWPYTELRHHNPPPR